MLLDPRNGEEFDLPPGSAPARTWVMASTPRTGSTLLCRALWDTGQVGAPKEYLNPMQVRDWEVRLGSRASRWRHALLKGSLLGLVGRGPWPDARLRDHLSRVRARRTGPHGHFGLKIHHHHVRRWFVDAGRDPDAWLGHPTWIRIQRRDRVAQAVSWARAVQTGHWASTQRAGWPPVYSRRHIAYRLACIEQDEAHWDRWFDAREEAPLVLHYEDVASDLEGTMKRVLRALGVSDDDLRVQPALARQADEISAAWCVRFRSEMGMPPA